MVRKRNKPTKALSITLLLIVLTLTVNIVSAFGETADFNETDGNYGSYKIESGWGILPKFLGGGDKAWIKLNNNTDYCLIDCSAKGTGYFYEPRNFLDGISFKNRLGEEEAELTNVKIIIGKVENITKQNAIYKEVCEENTKENGTYTSCYNKLTGYENYTKEEIIYTEYNGEEIEGNFTWEIKAKKNPGVDVDWIMTIWGEELTSWAWWDDDWEYKRNITNLTGTISALYNITYNANMKTDFSDIRFLDYATESTELNYTIISKVDSTEALIRLDNENETSVYMYYGNPLANSNSNASRVYFEPIVEYFFDTADAKDFSGNGYNGTVNGATLTTGIIDKGYAFSGSGQYIRTSNFDRTLNAYTVTFWMKWDDYNTASTQIITETADGLGKFLIHTNAASPNDLKFAPSAASTSCIFTNAIPNANFNHYVFLYDDNNNSRLYVNGVQSGSNCTEGFPTSIFVDDFNIGIRQTSTLALDGAVDEFYIYDREITNNEIINIYNQNLPSFIVGEEDVVGATINLISPQDTLQTTESYQTFRCNSSFSLPIANLTFTLNGIDKYTNSTTGLFIDLNYSENITTDGIYNWSCRAETVGGFTTQSENRTLTIHTTTPGAIVYYPQPLINYHLLGNNLTLNWTVTETGENLTTHIKNCTYEYNGTVTELNNTVCTQINETSFEYEIGVDSLIFNVTDTFDLVNSTNRTWIIKLTEINQTYNNETTEGSLETFLANIKIGSGYSITDAILFSYNNSMSIGQSFISGEYTTLRKADLLIPNVETDTNISFYWSITLSDATALNLSSQNQTIYNLNIDNCTTNTNELFNFTVIDEETQIILPNATIETAVNIYNEERTGLVLNYSNIFQGINPLRICINRNISSESFYSIDSITRYEDDDHANEYYNTVNQTLTNGTESQIITLYDLSLNDSTEFQLTFTGSDFLPVENALVYVERQYISENKFKTVELPKTDYNGQSVLHLVRNDIIYNVRIIKEGIVLGNFENLVAFCDDFTIGDCNIELNAFDSVESIFKYYEDLGIIYTEPTYNETLSIVSFNFLTYDGSAKEVLLEVTRNDIFGNRSICNSTLTSSGGTLQCNIDPNIDDSVLRVSIYTDNIITAKGSVQLDTENYGVAGYLIMFIMAISFILMFSGSKTGVLISIGLTFAGALGMGIVRGDLIGAGASGIWLLVIIFIGVYKLNKDKAS